MIYNYVVYDKTKRKNVNTFGNVKAAFDCCKYLFQIKSSYSTFKRRLEKHEIFETELVKVEKFIRLTKFQKSKKWKI